MKLRVTKDNEAMLVKKGDEFEVINVFEVFSCDGESEIKYEIDFETHKQSVFGKSGRWYEIVEKENYNEGYGMKFVEITPEEALEQLREDIRKLYLLNELKNELIHVENSNVPVVYFSTKKWFVKEDAK